MKIKEFNNKRIFVIVNVAIFLLVGVAILTYMRTLNSQEVGDVITTSTAVVTTTPKPTTVKSPKLTTTTVGSSGDRVKVFMKIAGMTCGGCVYRIENVLGDMSGIYSVYVSLSTESGTVEYNPNEISKETIANTITNLGYSATIISSEDEIGEVVKSAPVRRAGGGCGVGSCGCGCGGG